MARWLVRTFVMIGVTAGLVSCLSEYGSADPDEEVVSREPAKQTLRSEKNHDADASALGGNASAPLDAEELEAQFAALDEALEASPDDPEVKAWKARLNATTDEQAGLFLTIQVGSGHVVKFYEPSPGVMMLGEETSSDQELALKGVNAKSFADVYRHLRPEKAVPAAVLEADARAANPAFVRMPLELSDASVDSEGATPGLDGDDLIPKHATSSCSHFRDAHGCCPQTGDSYWCVCELTGSTYGYRTGTTHSWHGVGVYAGSVTFKITIPNSGGGPWAWAVAQGEVCTRWATSDYGSCGGCGLWMACSPAYCRREHRGDVYNASGDWYHWGACFDYDQTFGCP